MPILKKFTRAPIMKRNAIATKEEGPQPKGGRPAAFPHTALGSKGARVRKELFETGASSGQIAKKLGVSKGLVDSLKTQMFKEGIIARNKKRLAVYPQTHLDSQTAQIRKALFEASKNGSSESLTSIAGRLDVLPNWASRLKSTMINEGILKETPNEKPAVKTNATAPRKTDYTLLDSPKAKIRKALFYNEKNPKKTITELAEEFGVSQQTISNIKHGMIKEGILSGKKPKPYPATDLSSSAARVRKALFYGTGKKLKQIAQEEKVSMSYVQAIKTRMLREGIFERKAKKEPKPRKPKPQVQPKNTLERKINEELDRLGIKDRRERMLEFTRLAGERLPKPIIARTFRDFEKTAANAESWVEKLKARNQRKRATELELRIIAFRRVLAAARNMLPEVAEEFLAKKLSKLDLSAYRPSPFD